MQQHTSTSEKRRTHLFLVLSGIFISNALLAELIGVKIFSAEALFGLPGTQVPVLVGQSWILI